MKTMMNQKTCPKQGFDLLVLGLQLLGQFCEFNCMFPFFSRKKSTKRWSPEDNFG